MIGSSIYWLTSRPIDGVIPVCCLSTLVDWYIEQLIGRLNILFLFGELIGGSVD